VFLLSISQVVLLFSDSVMSNSVPSHGLQHARLPCPLLSTGVCSIISSSVAPFSCPQSFPTSGSSNELALCIKWPKYWGFTFSTGPFNEYSGWISFGIDWFDLLAVQGTLKSPLALQFESISSSALSLLYGPILTSIHDYWKNHSFD